MHDSLRMSCIESVGHLRSQIQDLFHFERLSADQVLERLPLQQFHGDEVLPVRFVDLVDRADVRMIERRRGEGFPLEAFASSRIVLHFRRQELQRDMAVQLEVFGLIHHTHPAAAELFQNPIVRDGLANHRELMAVTLSFSVDSSEHCFALRAAQALTISKQEYKRDGKVDLELADYSRSASRSAAATRSICSRVSSG